MVIPGLTLPPELLRGLMEHLPLPLLVVDVEGTVLFHNEQARALLGRASLALGPIAIEEWATLFVPSAEGGLPAALEDFPVVVALTRGRPAHQRLLARGPDRQPRALEVTALPIEQDGCVIGALVFVWPDDGRGARR